MKQQLKVLIPGYVMSIRETKLPVAHIRHHQVVRGTICTCTIRGKKQFNERFASNLEKL